jgi:hypothetical protein
MTLLLMVGLVDAKMGSIGPARPCTRIGAADRLSQCRPQTLMRWIRPRPARLDSKSPDAGDDGLSEFRNAGVREDGGNRRAKDDLLGVPMTDLNIVQRRIGEQENSRPTDSAPGPAASIAQRSWHRRPPPVRAAADCCAYLTL